MMGFRFGTAINCIDGRTQKTRARGNPAEKPSKLRPNAIGRRLGGIRSLHVKRFDC
jgi:hypothetical protein